MIDIKGKIKKKSVKQKSPKIKQKKKTVENTNMLLDKSFNYKNFKKKTTQKYNNNFKS